MLLRLWELKEHSMNKQIPCAIYDQDFYTWTLHNAGLLRQGKFSEIDTENIAEELESIGKRDKRQENFAFFALLQLRLKSFRFPGGISCLHQQNPRQKL
jgi:hypothetical protein